MKDFLLEYWEFIRANKAYWMVPILLALGLVGALVLYTQGSAVAPFIYSLF